MKTNFFKYSALLIAAVIATAASAQKKPSVHKVRSTLIHSSTYTTNGGRENITTEENGVAYELTFANGVLTELYVDDVKIPENKFADYSRIIGRIKEQMRLDKIQARKDQAQALLDQAQARRDQVQAGKDQSQAKLDQQQALRDQAQAKKDQEQAVRDQIQASTDARHANKEQADAKRDQEQANRDQEQAKHDQEQALRDQAQAKLDQEQAVKDQAQAKIDQKQAAEDQRVMKLMITDVVKDGLVPSEKELYALTISPNGMTVNDKQVPDEVFNRYKTKYSRFANGVFSYGNSNGSMSIRINKQK
jgi:colicin import membrane protein